MRRAGRPWLAIDDIVLRQAFEQMTDEQLAIKLSRSTATIRARRAKLGLVRTSVWTEQEEELVRAYYRTVPVPVLAATVKRSEEATRQKMRRMGIKLRALPRNQRAWSTVETQIIKENLDSPIPEIQRKLPVNRPMQTILTRALELGRKSSLNGFQVKVNGTILIRDKGKYIEQHRRVVEERIGRPLRKIERVHHINCDPSDNRSENLHLFSDPRSHGLCHGSVVPIVNELIESGAVEFDRKAGVYRVVKRTWITEQLHD